MSLQLWSEKLLHCFLASAYSSHITLTPTAHLCCNDHFYINALKMFDLFTKYP